MKELMIISGKGGTGKTSVAASLAALAGGVVVADCDVDAADLHLLLAPRVLERHDFYSGVEAVVDPRRCTGCGLCAAACRFGALVMPAGRVGDGSSACRDCDFCVRSCSTRANEDIREMAGAIEGVVVAPAVDAMACEGCGLCAWTCPVGAIEMRPRLCGEWMISRTRLGPMVHARLGVAAENSGKLVSQVRSAARQLAQSEGLGLVIVDGPPGIGCPVIASVTGATAALVVTEPTLSGLHDLQRVAELTRHFGVRTLLCVNKWDINEDLAGQIERQAAEAGVIPAGRVRYGRAVTDAQLWARTVVEFDAGCGVVQDIRELWSAVSGLLNMEKK